MKLDKTHPLKIERERHNFSQKILADFLVISEKTIRRAERGETISAHSRKLICEYFKKSAQELGLVAEESEKHPLPDMTRRNALKMFGAASSALIVGSQSILSNEPWEQLSRALSKPISIDSSLPTQLASIVKIQWQMRHSLNSQDHLHSIETYLRNATTMLQGSLEPNVRSKLCSVAGTIALLAGQTSFDLHNYSAANGYYKAALEAGQEAEDYQLQSFALGRIGFQMIYDKQPEKALTVLAMSSSLPTEQLTGITRAWLKCVEAEARAMLKDTTNSLQLLDTADKLFTVSDTEDDPDPFWTGMDSSMLNGYRGACCLHLQLPTEALAVLNTSLSSIAPTSIRRRSIVLADIAAAYTQQGEIDEACKVASQALVLYGQIKSGMVLERIINVKQAMGNKNIPMLRNLNEQLHMVS